MKLTNHVKITLPAIVGNEGFARAAVAAFCTPLSPSLEEINDIKTAVSEAVTNVIVHAYPDKNGIVEIEAAIYDDNVISITVSDEGIGLKDIGQAKKPFFTTKSAEEHSGMGFTIMEAFMDELDVRSEVGRGTVIVMRKAIKQRA